MCRTAKDQEQTCQDGPQTRPEPRVVVSRAFPFGEAILEEMVVAFAQGATQDVGDDVQTGGSLVCDLHGLVDFALRGTLRLGLVLGGVGDKGASGLVRVDLTGFLAVGLVDGFLVGVGGDL